MNVIGIKKINIPTESSTRNWTDHAEKTINKIANEWIETDYALFVLLFFNYINNKDIYAYMPLIPTDKLQRPEICDLLGAKNESKVIGVFNFQLEGISPNEKEIEIISNHMKSKYQWFGNEAFLLSIKGTTPDFVIKAKLKELFK